MIIYKATCKINGKSYIGQTDRSLEIRKKEHKKSTNQCRLLARAIKKYGFDSFAWTELQKCESLEEMNRLEDEYIRNLNTIVPNGYNLMYGGGSAGLRSEETCKLMSKVRTGMRFSKEHCANISKGRIGMKLSAAHRRAVSKALKGRPCSTKGIPHSEATKQKMSEAQKGEKNHFFGKTHTKKMIKFFSESQKGEKSPKFGKKESQETIEKKRLARLKNTTKFLCNETQTLYPSAKDAAKGLGINYSTFIKRAKKGLSVNNLTFTLIPPKAE